VKEEDEGGVARPKVISRRQARGDSEEGSDESASESEEESEEEDEAVTARRMAVRERWGATVAARGGGGVSARACRSPVLEGELTSPPQSLGFEVGVLDSANLTTGGDGGRWSLSLQIERVMW